MPIMKFFLFSHMNLSITKIINDHLQFFFLFEQNAYFLNCVKNFQIYCHFGPLFTLDSFWFLRSCDVCSGTYDFSPSLISFENKRHSFYTLVKNVQDMHFRVMWEQKILNMT